MFGSQSFRLQVWDIDAACEDSFDFMPKQYLKVTPKMRPENRENIG